MVPIQLFLCQRKKIHCSDVLIPFLFFFIFFSQAMFVFMGNFTSSPFGKDSSDVLEYKHHFDALADLLLGKKRREGGGGGGTGGRTAKKHHLCSR